MQNSELSVQGQSLQTLYNYYYKGLLQVNRRYQRKLVWTVEEKASLIDSVINRLPIPLILLAERPRGKAKYEIIDGLQRLDAFFSFMQNEFAYRDEYFDLDTIGDTKAQKDLLGLAQKEHRLSRDECLAIANYQIPVSIYRDASDSSIDEVFRRINSGGRRLSLQEIRQAGTMGPLPDLVRKASASIRSDGTFSDHIALGEVKHLSISRRGLDYGIAIEDIFWVRHEILGQDDVRSSGDEELVLDLVLDTVIQPWPTTGWQNRDAAYGLSRRIKTASPEEINAAISAANHERLHQQILAIIEFVDEMMRGHGPIGRHMVQLETYEKGTRRQFQAIFVALHSLLFEEGLEPRSSEAVRHVLKGFWNKELSIPTGGSAWGKEQKEKLYPQVQKKLRKAFFRPQPQRTISQLNSRKYIENILQGPIAEDPLIELKQGFCMLSDPPREDSELFEDILKTAVAMANHGRSSEGIVLIGIADKPEDAQRIKKLFGTDPIQILGRHLLTGTAAQLDFLGYSIDAWWRRWQEKIISSKVSSEFAHNLAKSFNPVYCDGLLLWELRPKSIDKPITYNGRFFVRVGPSTKELTADEFISTAITAFR
ncbi:DUF262 domain-containing protein [Micromonospora matsumotoense]|uniref:GmrSD restriction endonuclease domain-containing protein n=1 Tax=Micromonospora matsumotoense TaxID=121616 RepID=UPI00342B4C3F